MVNIGRFTGRTHSSHWGAFSVDVAADGALSVQPHPGDPEPTDLINNIPAAPRHRSRIAAPMVREGWLRDGPGPSSNRGRDPFVEVSWDTALDLLATELQRVRSEKGPEAIYGGSYGWASAGRFHHAQSQVHRFLCMFGGYTASVGSYSAGAAEVILPYVIGPRELVCSDGVTYDGILAESELVVAFGGLARRNQAVSAGGITHHSGGPMLDAAARRGCRFVSVSPIRDDLPGGEWWAIRPSTDVALMLGIAHTLVVGGLADLAFLERYTVGFDRFLEYLHGKYDGTPKSAAWAADITGVGALRIEELARDMAARRTVITVSHSLQRSEHGEQPVWMGVVLAAMLGRFGPGVGFAYALGALGNWGKPPLAVRLPTLPQGPNPVDSWIPVARHADMLLHPGEPYAFNGQLRRYPAISLVYWAGGNPFHHHQDLTRLERAWTRPDTIVVHEAYWTASARRADIVLPTTITLERDDLGAGPNDAHMIAMQRVVDPFGASRDDYDIFAGLADRLGFGPGFTEDKDAADWIRTLYARFRDTAADAGLAAPPFDEFWERGELDLPIRASGQWMERFLADPDAAPLLTPSGRIEIWSQTIAGFGYDDCPGHPTWLPKDETLLSARSAQFPLQLIANQPAGKLHSQLDFGAASQALKVAGREALRLNPGDAAARGILDGDVVRVFNDRGACLAGAVLDAALMPGVAQLSTGAWYDPDGSGVCRHGNPNMVTRDVGTSRLAQGCTGQLVLVEVRRLDGDPPEVRAFEPPPVRSSP